MKEFKLLNIDEVVAAGLPEDKDEYSEYRTFLVEFVDGKANRTVGVDGGEPEDQTFWRDWHWVVDELNKLAKEIKNDS